MMDPLTLAVIGGVAGTTTKEIWDFAKKWLNIYFKDHQPQAQQKANENGLDFLVELGNRLQILEDKINDNKEMKKCMENALSDPDFSAVLYNALISSARTSSHEKHKLLALIVEDRLQSKDESLKAIVSSMAVDVVPHLSTKHLHLLGVVSVFKYISQEIDIPKLSDEEARVWFTKWLFKGLSPMLPIETVNDIDFEHLISVSCIQDVFVKSHVAPYNFINYIQSRKQFRHWTANEFMKSEIGKEIKVLWPEIGNIKLTSTGLLIGINTYEALTNQTVDLDKHIK